MTNYGSNIKFKDGHRGTKKGVKYKWIASAHIEHPDTIFIHKDDKFWVKAPLDLIIKRTIKIIPHETIHQKLWEWGVDPYHGYDTVRTKILRKHRKKHPRVHDIYYANC